jgi:hypothetical protein
VATFVHFHEYKGNLGKKIHDLVNDTFKVMFTNTAPDAAANTVKADITEITAGNGYTAGGATLTGTSWAETGAGTGIWRLTFTDPSWTASGGSIGPARYVVIYDDTPTSPADPLLGYWDYETAFTITDGNTFTADIGAQGVSELS